MNPQIDYFIDGSCIGNNLKNSRRTAYALVQAIDRVFVYQESQLIVPPYPQTNQYAELKGFQQAMQHIQSHHHKTQVTIYSDSDYAIRCITEWGPTWKSQGWKRKRGGPLEHLDIICPLVEFWELNKEYITITHIAAHQTAAISRTYPFSGNTLADKLAKEKASSDPNPIHI